jgi:PAS domain S-box-containing protein
MSAAEARLDTEGAGVTIVEAELDTLLESVPDLISIHDGAGRYLYASPSIMRLVGRTREEVLGRTWREIGLMPDALLPMTQAGEQAMATGEPVIGEVSLASPEGTRRYEYTLSPVRDREGHIAAAIAVVRDITQRQLDKAERERLVAQLTLERERVAAAAEDAERRAAELNAIITSIDDAVNVYSSEGVLTHANPAAVAEFGFDPTGLTRETLLQRISPRHPDGRPLAVEEFPATRGLRGERVAQQRLLFMDSHGRERTALVSISPLAKNGLVRGAVEIWSDVTELEKALAGLAAERTLLHTMMEQMPAGVIIAEAPSGRITLMNQLARELLEHPFRVAQDIEHVIRYPQRMHRPNGEVLGTDLPPLTRALRDGESVIGEEVHLTRTDGSERVLSINAGPIRRPDTLVEVAVATIHDITERRVAERERDAARQRLLATERERKNFNREVIRAITHDRFCLVEAREIPTIGRLVLTLPLEDEESYRTIRECLIETSTRAGMDEARAQDLVLAAGEAITNAIKHGREPRASVYSDSERVTLRACDKGPGIRAEDIPSSLFRRGFSTRVSLGMGYTIMLELADRLWLSTGPEGTLLQIEKRVHPEETSEEPPLVWEKL